MAKRRSRTSRAKNTYRRTSQRASSFGSKLGLGNFNSIKGIAALLTSAVGTSVLGGVIASKLNLNIDPRIVTAVVGFFMGGPLGAAMAIFMPSLLGQLNPTNSQKSETSNGLQVWS